MNIQSLPIRLAQRAIEPMLEAHFKEVGNTAVYDLDPDWPKYYQIGPNGIWLVAVDGSECIGYSFNFVVPHIHYRKQLVCYNDVIFTRSGARGSLAGGRLLLATREHARSRGCVVVQYHAKPDTALDRTLAKRLPLFERAYTEKL